MKPARHDRLADYVRPRLSPARVDRMWSAIGSSGSTQSGRAGRGPRFLRVFAAAAVVLLGLGALSFAALRARHARHEPALEARRDPIEGWVFETAGASERTQFPDGSALELAAGSKLRVDGTSDDTLRLHLERGSVDCDLARDGHGLRLTLGSAASLEITARDARFVASVTPSGDLAVSVSRGTVRLHGKSGDTDAILGAGQQWTKSKDSFEPSDPTDPSISQHLPDPSSTKPSTLSAAASTSVNGPPIAPAALSSTTSTSVTPSATVVPKASDTTPTDAAGWYALADEARLAGRQKEAADAFHHVYMDFPGDPRAGVAAYELGRIRLDSLGDPAGAAEAFASAIQLAPAAPFRENAEARRVEALERSGQVSLCQAARARFLADHPASTLGSLVTKRCP